MGTARTKPGEIYGDILHVVGGPARMKQGQTLAREALRTMRKPKASAAELDKAAMKLRTVTYWIRQQAWIKSGAPEDSPDELRILVEGITSWEGTKIVAHSTYGPSGTGDTVRDALLDLVDKIAPK